MTKVEGIKFLSELLDLEPVLDDDTPSNKMIFYDRKNDLTFVMTFMPPIIDGDTTTWDKAVKDSKSV